MKIFEVGCKVRSIHKTRSRYLGNGKIMAVYGDTVLVVWENSIRRGPVLERKKNIRHHPRIKQPSKGAKK